MPPPPPNVRLTKTELAKLTGEAAQIDLSGQRKAEPTRKPVLDEKEAHRNAVAAIALHDGKPEQLKAWLMKGIRGAARRHQRFTSDEVWEFLGTAPPSASDGLTLGNIMQAAAREGVCTSTEEFRKSKRPECNQRPIRIWVSHLYDESKQEGLFGEDTVQPVAGSGDTEAPVVRPEADHEASGEAPRAERESGAKLAEAVCVCHLLPPGGRCYYCRRGPVTEAEKAEAVQAGIDRKIGRKTIDPITRDQLFDEERKRLAKKRGRKKKP